MSNKFLNILGTRMNGTNCAIIFQAKTSIDDKQEFLLNESNPGYLLYFTAPIFSEASIKKWCSNGTSSVPKCTFFVSTKKMKVYWKKYIKCLTRHRIIRKISHF